MNLCYLFTNSENGAVRGIKTDPSVWDKAYVFFDSREAKNDNHHCRQRAPGERISCRGPGSDIYLPAAWRLVFTWWTKESPPAFQHGFSIPESPVPCHRAIFAVLSWLPPVMR